MTDTRSQGNFAVSNVRFEALSGDTAWPLVAPLLEEVWPPEVMATLTWRDVTFAHADSRIVGFDATGNVVCHVGIYRRSMRWNSTPVEVGGIGAVCTSSAYRRQGAASAALRLATHIFRDENYDFGLLFCDPDKFAYYASVGWRRFAGTVTMDQSAGRTTMATMTPFVFPLSVAADSGTLDLCGLPW